jgi:hypothetical protein
MPFKIEAAGRRVVKTMTIHRAVMLHVLTNRDVSTQMPEQQITVVMIARGIIIGTTNKNVVNMMIPISQLTQCVAPVVAETRPERDLEKSAGRVKDAQVKVPRLVLGAAAAIGIVAVRPRAMQVVTIVLR